LQYLKKERKNKMSLDVYLKRERYISYDKGKTYQEDSETLYWANITHNLNVMAEKAGIYEALWRPHKLIEGYDIPESDNIAEWEFEEKNKIQAKAIIPLLEKGLEDLIARPEYFKTFDSKNGWGTYDHFVPFVAEYLKACRQYPEAIVETSR
jgi:hypothetical protein